MKEEHIKDDDDEEEEDDDDDDDDDDNEIGAGSASLRDLGSGSVGSSPPADEIAPWSA